MTNTFDGFLEEADRYIAVFNEWVEQYTPNGVADHICYKCSSSEEYSTLRAIFESSSAFIYQSIISQRRIAVVKFLRPIPTRLGDIWYLELSDQKPDGSQLSGFDHIEIFPKDGSMEDFIRELESSHIQGEKIIRPHHTTYDIVIQDSFKVRVEPEPLIVKIMATEMKYE